MTITDDEVAAGLKYLAMRMELVKAGQTTLTTAELMFIDEARTWMPFQEAPANAPEKPAAPTRPCGCLHYMGHVFSACQGPHTTGSGDSLRWVEDSNN